MSPGHPPEQVKKVAVLFHKGGTAARYTTEGNVPIPYRVPSAQEILPSQRVCTRLDLVLKTLSKKTPRKHHISVRKTNPKLHVEKSSILESVKRQKIPLKFLSKMTF